MASKEERSLARRMFRCTCMLANATAFQDLVWAVKKAKHGSAFEPVGPQGSKGDGGNDGYIPSDKHYHQLYAPIDPNEKAGVAATKVTQDFAKLKTQWGGSKGRGVSRFTFVYNDKYHGCPKDISLALEGLRKKHKAIAFDHCGAADLETDFMSLPETEWDRILGGAVPDPDRIAILDYSVFADVVRHVMSCEVGGAESRFNLPPSLEVKVKLNGLSSAHSALIGSGALYTGHIEKYFAGNSNDALTELRDHVVGVFEAAKKAVATTERSDKVTEVDAVFAIFRRSLFPKSSRLGTSTAVDAVIGYFFETCDVFDPKPEAKGRPGATPG